MAAVSAHRFLLTFPATQPIRQKLESRELTGEEAAKTVRKSDIMFQQQKLHI